METTPTKLSHNEIIKEAIPTLAGTLAQNLADSGLDKFSEDDAQFLKFHGCYQQADRDLRKTGRKFIFMVRLRLPGGVMSPAQYLTCDGLSARYANNTLRVTSRQSIQFHGIVKSGLRPLIQGVNEALISTLAACGDVNRNVMAPPAPALNGLGQQVREQARQLALALAPRTRAYHSIWIDGVQLNLDAPENKNFVDPLYGKTYLPRKFKIGFVIPPHNDVDILANCCGFIAITDSAGKLAGYNLSAGGGMGRSHGNEATFPRIADLIGFLPANKVEDVARAALTIHRDFGDRADRKHARLKYVIADRGAAWFREELERRTGFKLEEPRPFKFTSQGDPFGWHRQADGKLFLGLFMETGRITDRPHWRMKSALRAVVEQFQTEVRLTPANNAILVNIRPEDQVAITAAFASHGIDVAKQGSVLRRSSMACVSLPTCGMALAESERYLPDLVTRLETALTEAGLPNEEINIRMTGCPNGCARPYLAEIGLVGKAPGRYQIWLGGNQTSTRLNRVYRDSVKDLDLIAELQPLFVRFAAERLPGEGFGDFCHRAILPQSTPAAA